MRDDVKMSEGYVTLYDSTGRKGYALYNIRASDENNALDSYTITGGENDPFEVVKLSIPRKKLKQVASDLTKPNAVVNGVNKLHINAVGYGTYIVVENDLDGIDNTVTVTAYCQAYKVTEKTLTTNVTAVPPFQLIRDILTTNIYGGPYIAGEFKYWLIDKTNPEDRLNFVIGQRLWDVLQVCAMYLGCKIFFAGNDAYLVDYRLAVNRDMITMSSTGGTNASLGFSCSTEEIMGDNGLPTDPRTYTPNSMYDFGSIELYTKDAARPEYGKCVGQLKLGNEGQTTIVNKVIIECADNVTVTMNDAVAQRVYSNLEKTEKKSTLTTLKELKDDAEIDGNTIIYRQGSVIAANILDYLSEGQQSVEFSMKELQNVGGQTHWIAFFPPCSRIKALDDEIDDVHVNNTSVLNTTCIKPQKLALSSYTRRFPDGVTTYKFGVIASVDLAQKISDLSAGQQ